MKKIIAFLLVFALIFVSFVSVFAEEEEETFFLPFRLSEFGRLNQMQNVITRNVLYDDVDAGFLFGEALREILRQHPELYEMAARAMLSSIDESSSFRNYEEARAFEASFQGEFGGIGVHIMQTARGAWVTSVIDGGPAQRAGIMAEDIIIEVDSDSLAGLTQEQAILHIRGEIGSVAKILVERSGAEEHLLFEIERGVLYETPVHYTILEEYDILYLQIFTFNSRTSLYVDEALAAAYAAGITKVILDLRNNAGGMVDQAISLANHFVYGERPIVIQRFNERIGEEVFYSTLVEKKYDVVVLVNGSSASASEIVAGAIQDNKAGIVVGRTTFGKATVQSWGTMWWGDSITYTIAHYLTPNRNFIHGRGIDPNVYVENRMEFFDTGEFGPFSYSATHRVGDNADDVRFAKFAFDAMNIFVGDVTSGYFDENLKLRIQSFQELAGLPITGELCPATQVNLFIHLQNTLVIVDLQFEMALQILREIE